MTIFIWAKMQAAGGEELEQIIERKEAERSTGGGIFWWGHGTSLGPAAETKATMNEGSLPILFSKMISPPQKKDSAPREVCVWDAWRSPSGNHGRLPEHVLVTGGHDPGKPYYAMACYSDVCLALIDHGPFDPKQCRTMLEKLPGSSQVTSLLRDTCPDDHPSGLYRIGFRATMKCPWGARMTHGRLLTEAERRMLDLFKEGDDWMVLVNSLRDKVSY